MPSPLDDLPLPVLPVRIEWHSETEHLTGTFDHAMLIVPEGPGSHRVYFAGPTIRHIAQCTAVVMEMAVKNAGGRPMTLALEILQDPDNDTGEDIRGTPVYP